MSTNLKTGTYRQGPIPSGVTNALVRSLSSDAVNFRLVDGFVVTTPAKPLAVEDRSQYWAFTAINGSINEFSGPLLRIVDLWKSITKSYPDKFENLMATVTNYDHLGFVVMTGFIEPETGDLVQGRAQAYQRTVRELTLELLGALQKYNQSSESHPDPQIRIKGDAAPEDDDIICSSALVRDAAQNWLIEDAKCASKRKALDAEFIDGVTQNIPQAVGRYPEARSARSVMLEGCFDAFNDRRSVVTVRFGNGNRSIMATVPEPLRDGTIADILHGQRCNIKLEVREQCIGGSTRFLSYILKDFRLVDPNAPTQLNAMPTSREILFDFRERRIRPSTKPKSQERRELGISGTTHTAST